MDKLETKEKNFFINDEKEYKPFNTFNLNGCIYAFKDIYKDDDNNYFILKNKKYSKIKKNKIGSEEFIKIKDVNGNNIIVII